MRTFLQTCQYKSWHTIMRGGNLLHICQVSLVVTHVWVSVCVSFFLLLLCYPLGAGMIDGSDFSKSKSRQTAVGGGRLTDWIFDSSLRGSSCVVCITLNKLIKTTPTFELRYSLLMRITAGKREKCSNWIYCHCQNCSFLLHILISHLNVQTTKEKKVSNAAN